MKKSCGMVGTLLLASLGSTGCVVDGAEVEEGDDALGEATQALTSSPALRDFGQVSVQAGTVWSSVVVDSQGVTVSGCQCGMSNQLFGYSSCPTTFKGTRTVPVSFTPPSTPGTYTGTFTLSCSGSVSASSGVKAAVWGNHNGTLLRAGGVKPRAGRKAGRRARAGGAAPSTRRPR